MTRFFYLIFILFSTSVGVRAQMQFFMSPDGNDGNIGTKEQPLASLTGARDAIRQYKNSHSNFGSIEVIIADGVYEMKEPFVLTAEDAGTKDCPIIYKAARDARPVFSGGKRIEGFKETKDGIWKVEIPQTKLYHWRFDQLYMNDKRLRLAQTPNKGFLKMTDVKENIWLQGSGRSPEKAEQILSFNETDFGYLKNLSDEDVALIRFRAFHNWDFTLRYIDKIDNESKSLSTSGRGMKPWNSLKKGGRIVLENYSGALDTAGEWFLSVRGILSYIPEPGQRIEDANFVMPVLENLMSIKGDASADSFVEYITFEDLSFKYCHYQMPNTGFEPNQAAASVKAAIMMEGVQHISFLNCEVSHTGQHAIWLAKGCSYSTIQHNYLHDIGGGGIYLGDLRALENTEHTHHIQIDNNIIQSGGREFPPAVGVWVGHSSDNIITHNDIGDFYYSGISVGWVWGYGPSLAKQNTITFNHIHHIGWDLLSDMAAVYTLGKSEGTIINHNVIHHIHAYSYGGWGLYTDEGSTGIEMKNNLVYRTKTGGFHQHYGENNVIENNIFAFAQLFQIQCTRVEEHRSFNFNHNIIVFNKGVVLQGAWQKIDIEMDHNLYWNMAGNTYDFAGQSFKKWKKTGHDQNSMIEDPVFKDASHDDFRFEDTKVVNKIGFIPFDISKAGVYGSEEWKETAKLPETTLRAFDQAVKENMNK